MATQVASSIRGGHQRFTHVRWGLLRRAGSALKSTLALVGGVVTVGAVGSLASTYFAENQVLLEETANAANGKKKRVLVLPFNRMSIVEQKASLLSQFMRASDLNKSSDDRLTVEVQELVNVLHAAAADPSIVALYGVFGDGADLSSVGWAHLEEVRNALKVFRESHRLHGTANVDYKNAPDQTPAKNPKPLYAYAVSFPFVSSGNQSYYLASAFTHVHLQRQGVLQLYGLHNTTFFIRKLLDTYGIKVNVLKHGDYKNTPNMFTENGFTREHKENVENILSSLNRKTHDDVVANRGLLSNVSWKSVHDYGTFTAQRAKDIGFVDYLVDRDPLDDLVESSSNEKKHKEFKSKLGDQTNLEAFTANKAISFKDYAQVVARRKRMESRKWNSYKRFKYFAENSTAAKALLDMFGYQAPFYNMRNNPLFSPEKAASLDEKIAVVRINDTISDEVARKVADSLKEIKKDKKVKSIILRINSPGGSVAASEHIFQECKVMPQPVICSMGNVAASGGYYVAANAARIFALPTTVTGSIGVFGVRPDFGGFAESYGVNMGFVSTGKHAAVNDMFHPLTKVMETNIQADIDRTYDYFKSLVAEGRSLPIEEVEKVAQGRVWTGEQAKEHGLVDELGGLERAISYAQRNYASGGANVEFWPKEKESFFKQLLRGTLGESEKVAILMNVIGLPSEEARQQMPMGGLESSFLRSLSRSSFVGPEFGRSVNFSNLPNIYATADENMAIECLLSDLASRKD